MEKETITDNLEKLLMAIHRQVVVIRDSEQQVPKIEMDKTLSNIRALYEQFTVLNYLNSNPTEKKIVTAEQTIAPKVAEPVKPIVEEKHVEAEKPFIPIVEKQEQIIPAPELNVQTSRQNSISAEPEFEISKPKQHESYMPPKKEEPVIQKQPVAESVNPVIETPSQTPKTVASSATDAQRLGDKLRQSKIDDIHKAVPLSDKFLFMNELFEAENNAYKEAVDMLNRLTTANEAEHYMDSLAARYGWAKNAKTEKKFRDIVLRKFV